MISTYFESGERWVVGMGLGQPWIDVTQFEWWVPLCSFYYMAYICVYFIYVRNSAQDIKSIK